MELHGFRSDAATSQILVERVSRVSFCPDVRPGLRAAVWIQAVHNGDRPLSRIASGRSLSPYPQPKTG